MNSVTIEDRPPPSATQLDPDYWGAIGNTPLIRLCRVTAGLPDGVEVFAKAEWFNPGGSVKDRPAAAILRHALAEGQLDHGRVFLDSTSGNMGISYATLGAALGIPIHIVIPSNASPERITILRSLGAELTLSDPLEGSDGARDVAFEMAREDPDRFYYANQYSHPANLVAHYRTTGPEIYTQTSGRLTHFVAGLGTTGTMTGTGRYLKEVLPDVRLVAVQPDGPLHGLEGLKYLTTENVPQIYDATIPDKILEIQTEETYAMARRLANEEGMLVGISSAAAAVAALQIGAQLDEGVIVTLFPDSGVKYLSQPFWRSS
ncbi:MAG: pyridoxal-phosphate dependent enzyme [Anaerolineales bacterium]|nr:pyridoxal-phosphate dependent enzyme [Anaerolineales bacterium]